MSIDNNKYCIKQMSRPTQCVQLSNDEFAFSKSSQAL